MEYYSAIKKNKIMPFAATWMELETLILSEVRKRQIPHDTMWIKVISSIKYMLFYICNPKCRLIFPP